MSEIFQRHNRYIPSNVEKLVHMKDSDRTYRLISVMSKEQFDNQLK